MTIKIQIQNNESLVEIILDRDVNAKKAFEIQKILKPFILQVLILKF